jgi:hypothetical protein
MKTRQEMIYDFMLALAPSYLQICKEIDATNELMMVELDPAEEVKMMAEQLTEAYFKDVS